MRLTIPQAIVLFLAVTSVSVARVAAQDTPAKIQDPFAAGRWHFEAQAHAAVEAWNYNVSHEEIYGVQEGITYGLRDGLVLVATQRLSYVSQRANDSFVIGLTAGLRQRVGRWRRAHLFLEFQVGASEAAIAAPPRGTRFNYLATGAAGVAVPWRGRLTILGSLHLLHVSNNSLKGPSRNPDIEAIGPSVGILVGF